MYKIYLTFLLPLFLSSCMMLGIDGMKHGGSHNEKTQQQKTVVKESIVDGIRITVEFPPYTLADELVYKVNLYDVREKLIISDALISLIVTPDNDRSHDSHSDHSKMQEMKFSPDEIKNGAYIFRPIIKDTGAYKFIFVLDRVGNFNIVPPIEVEQNIQLSSQMDMHSEDGDNMEGSGISHVVLMGSVSMAIMMLFMLKLF